MKRNKILLAFLSFLLILSVFPITSCSEKEPATQQDLEALLTESADEMQSAKNISTSNTGSFSLEIPQLAEEAGLEVGVISGELTFTTAMNTDEKEMEMNMNASVNLGESISMDIEFDYWYVDEWHYLHFNIPFVGEQWGKSNQSMDEMEQFVDSSGNIADLLLDNLQMEYLGKEDIDGEANYRIKIVPTEEAFKKLIEWIASNTDGTSEDVTETLNNETFKTVMDRLVDGIQLELWVDKSTKLISQVKFVLDMELSSDELEMDELQSDSGNIKMFFDIVMNMKAQDETIKITPPEEALNAEEFEDMGSLFN